MRYRDRTYVWGAPCIEYAAAEADANIIGRIPDANALGTTKAVRCDIDGTITQLLASLTQLGTAPQAGSTAPSGQTAVNVTKAGLFIELHAVPAAANGDWTYTASSMSHNALAKWAPGFTPHVRIDIEAGTWLGVVVRDNKPLAADVNDTQLGATAYLHAGIVVAPR